MEEGGGGEGVAPGFLLGVGHAAAGHGPVCLCGGEAFVVEVDGEVGALVEVEGEGAGELGAGAFGVIHVDGEAQDEVCGLVVAGGGGEGVEEAIALGDEDLDGAEGRGDACDGVGAGEAGAFVAEVDGEVAADGVGHGGRICAAASPAGSCSPRRAGVYARAAWGLSSSRWMGSVGVVAPS